MLNVSRNRIEGKIDTDKYKSFSMVGGHNPGKLFSRLLKISFALLIVILFLPWTQNIRSKGFITTLRPNQRPQTVHSVIAGRIEKWFVLEGSHVKKGDTILFISEIKDAYFDPQLLSRTDKQIDAKKQTVNSYVEKVKAIDAQVRALNQTKKLKIQQAQNYLVQAELKIKSDSINLQAAETNFQIAERQLKRTKKLYDDGLKSLTDLEVKKLKLQETQAKRISAENKLLSARNSRINAIVELSSIENQYMDKLSKATSEKYTALSNQYNAEGSVTKMQNQYTNYSVRTGLHYITAPQDGFITKTIRSGIGETIKEGEKLLTIMPEKYDLAVAMYVRPVDLPLINIGEHVRFIFDGWPTVIFSGWPNLSHGTFGGNVFAIDKMISENGQYRILVAPDPEDSPWPEPLRVGSGASGMTLLNDVPIWYEIWRNMNGFPPDYYQVEKKDKEKMEEKGSKNADFVN